MAPDLSVLRLRRQAAPRGALVVVFHAVECLQQRKGAPIEAGPGQQGLETRIVGHTASQEPLAVAAQQPRKVVGRIAQARRSEIDDARDAARRLVPEDVAGPEIAVLETEPLLAPPVGPKVRLKGARDTLLRVGPHKREKLVPHAAHGNQPFVPGIVAG